MEAVTMYKAKNGQVFETAVEAELKDTELELYALVDKKGYSTMSTDAMGNILFENDFEFYILLCKIRGFKSIIESKKSKQ